MSVIIDEDSKFPAYDSFNILGSYKIPFVILLIVIILIYIFLFSLLNNATMDNPSSKWWILILEIILFVTLIIIVALNVKLLRDKHYSFTASLKNLFDNTPEIEIDVSGNDVSGNNKDKDSSANSCTPAVKEEDENEVFNIPNNIYTYTEAQDVCKSLNSRLATLDELEEAYKNGANWCSYGWSEEQMALFPIQKSVYNDLKKTKNHAHDCGRPGVNGGYFPNKSTKFGINCYGKKPYRTDKDKVYQTHVNYSPAYPDLSDNDVDVMAEHIILAPFNTVRWAEEYD